MLSWLSSWIFTPTTSAENFKAESPAAEAPSEEPVLVEKSTESEAEPVAKDESLTLEDQVKIMLLKQAMQAVTVAPKPMRKLKPEHAFYHDSVPQKAVNRQQTQPLHQPDKNRQSACSTPRSSSKPQRAQRKGERRTEQAVKKMLSV